MVTVKDKVHQLVDSCKNEELLEEVKTLLETSKQEDWWNELTPKEQQLLLESEAQYEKKEFISHSELMKRFEEWKKK
jgi:hypothetical protein